MTGSDLKDRVTVLSLQMGGDGWAWVPTVPSWAKVVQEDRQNYFSTIGLGARSATVTMRRRPLDLHQALRWRGQHLCLTSIVEEVPGWLTVKAALAEPERLTVRPQAVTGLDKLNRPVLQDQAPIHFPGILTQEYRREDGDGLHEATVEQLVLVTPKAVTLTPGDLVERKGSSSYIVVRAMNLDPWKNEYIIERQVDV